MTSTNAEVLFSPESSDLRFLPEGPYSLGSGQFSWVAIQHGASATVGSINTFDLHSRTNNNYPLPGRPGFAFPTDHPGIFIAGVERTVGLFDTRSGNWTPLLPDVEQNVENTIINDAVVFDGYLIFGCKELEFQTPKAGLYLWRYGLPAAIRLRDDQICSNGKAVVRNPDHSLLLYDIDSCTKRITRSKLDLLAATVSDYETVVDLTDESVFPDGMILTPDEKSLIVALYDPGDPTAGQARQYSLADGRLEHTWHCPGSPRVTCPQLVEFNDKIWLVLTTAVEHMSPDQQQNHPAAGCLFIAPTDFTSLGAQPVFPITG